MIKKGGLIFLIGCVWNVVVFGQDNNEINSSLGYLNDQSSLLPTTEFNNAITLQGSLRENSNTVPFALPLNILGKQTISRETRNHAKNYPFKRVKYEDELKTGITYQHYFSKPQVNFFVSYYLRNLRFANVTKDALNIAMFGNAMYEDKTADLSDVSFENVMYNQFSVGVGKTHKNLYVAANLSFLQGFSDQQLHNKQGSFYTAPYGEYIDARYNFVYNQSSEEPSSFFTPRGLGFSGDLHLSYKFNVGTLQFDAQDIGFISWSQQPMNYANDTAIHFEGVVSGSALDLNNIISNFNLDSTLQKLVSDKTHKSYKTILPSTFTLSFMHIVNAKGTKIQLSYGLQTRLLYQYYVLGYVKASVFLPKNLITSVSVSGGGYSLFNVGWDLGWYSSHYQISFGTHNLIGLVAPTAYPSTSLDLRFSYRF